MRLLLDTTYFLPAIGVAISGVPRTTVKDLRSGGHSVGVSTITLFELAAIGAKFSASGKLESRDVMSGLSAIIHDAHIERFSFEESGVLRRAIEVRKYINDFVDCLILATAATSMEALVTEDNRLPEYVSEGTVMDRLDPLDADFRILPFRKVE